jgi:hypothetical protein
LGHDEIAEDKDNSRSINRQVASKTLAQKHEGHRFHWLVSHHIEYRAIDPTPIIEQALFGPKKFTCEQQLPAKKTKFDK